MEKIILNNGVEMPILGLGVYQIPDLAECERVCGEALAAGYRLIDTAAGYNNETSVGAAVRKSGIPRNEIFVTTKVWVADFGDGKTEKAVDKALKNLDIEYIDLILLHQAMGDYYGAYRDLQKCLKAGKVRAIGVSNFYPNRLADLCLNVEVKPAVNQIECHPFYTKEKDLAVMKEFGVAPMAWAPFAEGGHNIWNNPVLEEIAQKHHKTVAQIVLRWNIQRGVIVIPKSVHKNRIEENFNVFDFMLDKGDMAKISALDTGKTEIFDHYDIELVKLCNTLGREKR